jgi:hypothetical protein
MASSPKNAEVDHHVLTCHCTFDLWADDVTTCPVDVHAGEVWVRVEFGHREPAAYWRQRLYEGMAHNLGLVIAKALQGQLAAGVDPLDIVRQAAVFGARNRDGWGMGMTILTALGNLLAILPKEETYLARVSRMRQLNTGREDLKVQPNFRSESA